MKIQASVENRNIIVLAVSGRLTTQVVPTLEETLNKSLEMSANIILDLAEVSFLASSALRVLLDVQKKAAEKKGNIRLRNVTPLVKQVLSLTGFINLLNIE